LVLEGGTGVRARADTAPAPTRTVTHPDWGGITAAQYLAALQANHQYPDFDMAVDGTYDNLLSGAWMEEPQAWDDMDPADAASSSSAAAPQYLFTTDRTILVGTSGEKVTATLAIGQSPTSKDQTSLQVISAQLIGSTAYDGQVVATVPSSCKGAVCTFVWTNPNLDAQYWGPLTIKATVSSNDYPGTWVVYKDFYSSPTMAGKFTGQFTDSIVSGSLVINAGVHIYPNSYPNQQLACTVSANLYSVDHGWPLQHYEEAVLLDPSTTTIPLTFFGKIFTDYGDAGTFSLNDLKVQCLNLPYPAAWEMDPITHKADLDNWGAANANGTTDTYEPPYIYFAQYNSSYTTAKYANNVFSNAPYQTSQQTNAMVPNVVNFANAESAGTAAYNMVQTNADGSTSYVNGAGMTATLIFIHGRLDPNTCPDSPNSTDGKFHREQFGLSLRDQCNLWFKAPVTNTSTVYVQWNSWDHFFDDTSPNGGNYWVRSAIIDYCGNDKNTVCHFICHSAGCAALEQVLARLRSERLLHKFNLANVLAAASAAGGSELANHGWGLPEGTVTAHKVARIDRSLTTNYARNAYNHDHMEIPVRAIAGTQLNSAPVEIVAKWFPHQSTTNTQCFKLGITDKSVCIDDDVSLHSGCGHRHRAFYEACGSTFRQSPNYQPGKTFDWHGFWIDDSENPSGTHVTGPFSSQGRADYENSFHAYYVSHGPARDLADFEYQACYFDNHAWLCP
jgi:hypothetical protein